MKNILIVLASLSSSAAFADGFVCVNETDRIAVKVYNHTHSEDGTRNGAVMIVSNQVSPRGFRTAAKFKDATSKLSNESSVYTAKVDLRYSDTNKDGQIAHVNIADISTITLDVDFSYANPVRDGAHVNGNLYLNTRDGETVSYLLDCARYLKN